MDVREFFELCVGQWVSQRTLHHIQTEKTDVGKADLWIEAVESSSPSVLKTCETFELALNQVISPLEITYKATLANGRSQINTTLMIPVAKATAGTEGNLISVPEQGKPIIGTFSFGTDEVMTFTNPQGEHQVSERIWYASENLRMRSTTLVDQDGPAEANFYSEIRRMGTTQPKPSLEDETQSSPFAAWRARQANSAD